MFSVDHQELEPPMMLCPFRQTSDGRPCVCMGEPCALWFPSSNEDYEGCAPFVTAFYACSMSYNSRQLVNLTRYANR